MNKNARKKKAAVGLALALALGVSGVIRAGTPATSASGPTTAACNQMTNRISQLITDGDAIVAQNRAEQTMHGKDPSALINRAENLAIAEVKSSEANTLARTAESMGCRSGADAGECSQTSAKISELTADTDRIMAENRSDQSLHNPAALLNRVGSTYIAQKESNDANTLAILSAERNCASGPVASDCNHTNAAIQQLTEDSDSLVYRNMANQTAQTRTYFLVYRVQDPSALINRMANITIAQSKAKEANTLAIIRGARRCPV